MASKANVYKHRIKQTMSERKKNGPILVKKKIYSRDTLQEIINTVLRRAGTSERYKRRRENRVCSRGEDRTSDIFCREKSGKRLQPPPPRRSFDTVARVRISSTVMSVYCIGTVIASAQTQRTTASAEKYARIYTASRTRTRWSVDGHRLIISRTFSLAEQRRSEEQMTGDDDDDDVFPDGLACVCVMCIRVRLVSIVTTAVVIAPPPPPPRYRLIRQRGIRYNIMVTRDNGGLIRTERKKKKRRKVYII